MKTQIIQLEPHDDVISTRDKMGWSQTGRVLLVWPNRGHVLTNRLDLVLLLRHSSNQGIQLGLVTHDTDVRFHASQLGIPVFDKIRQAQEIRWRRALRHKPRIIPVRSPNGEASLTPKIPQKPKQRNLSEGTALPPAARFVLFTIGVLAFLSISAALLPTAELTLTPKTEIQAITLTVTGSTSIDRVNFSGLVPIHPIKTVVEGRQSMISSGSILVPEQTSTGHALFTNLSDRAVTIPIGTVVTTHDSSIQFDTDQAGIVPAGPGQTKLLTIKAFNPGSAYNLPAGRLQAIQGPLGTDLSVTNPEATSGGTDHSSPAPSSLDHSQLYNQLFSSLQKSAGTEVQAGLKPGDLLLTSSPTLTHTIEETYDPPDNQPADQLSLTLRLQFQALIISGDDLKELATAILDTNLPTGYLSYPQTIKITHLTNPEYKDESTVQWVLCASREIEAQIPEIQAANLAIGLSPEQASQRLSEVLPLSEAPHIDLFPSWWPRLPIIPFRIQVKMNLTN